MVASQSEEQASASVATARGVFGARYYLRMLARARAGFKRFFLGLGSSLTRRILLLNLAGLVALLVGFLYLNQFREGLIDARVQTLLTQGEIIAGAIASSATAESEATNIDPEKLLQLQLGESFGSADDGLSPLDFYINPERVAPILRRLVTPTRTRARIYDREGALVTDSQALISRGSILRLDLPPLVRDEPTIVERAWSLVKNRLGKPDVISREEIGAINGRRLQEIVRALDGQKASVVRVNTSGETIISVAVPIQRHRAVRGALLLSTQGGDIDAIIANERWALLQVFLVAAGVMAVLSMLLAGAIAEPMRRLADAADRVRRGGKSRHEIPDFTNRADEIGHLSGALRDMTGALYNRIEAIESFAADVAHELKNPLTSLRSAVETLPLARDADSRSRLMDVIQHDVRRLDRLISDISDASRLDAEMARADFEPIDLSHLLEAVVGLTNDMSRPQHAEIVLSIAPEARPRDAYLVMGNDSRMGQVITNLIDNARSFAPMGTTVRVTLARLGDEIEILIDDDGPGVPPHALERIFERFYTDRPSQGFGQNSGLGLSISRQIIDAHKGQIWAQNRPGPFGADGRLTSAGARFIVRLPAAMKR
jgi:two-component system, OmpR family, sensor histidine kinase ChvG